MTRSIQLENRVLFITCILILLFAYTASSKLLDVRHFQVVLSQSPMLGRWAYPLGYSLPLVELLAAVLLLIPAERSTGLLVSFLLMLLFTAYVAGMLLFAQKLPCSCGGILQQMSWKTHLLFNAVTTVAAFWAWRRSATSLLRQRVVVQQV